MRTGTEYEAAARAAGCRLVAIGSFGGEPAAHFSCDDGWQSARLLLALARQAASDPRVVAVAGALARAKGDSVDARARLLHAWVKSRVQFVREEAETFSGAGWLVSEIAARGSAQGDCDCQAQLVYAVARAAAIPVAMVFLATADTGQPLHVVCKLNGEWAETTVDAAYGEHPLAAAERLRLKGREDLRGAREVTMGETRRGMWGVAIPDLSGLEGDAPEPVHSRDVSDDDLRAIVDAFAGEGIDPADALDVMFSESGLRPHVKNREGYAGINQMGEAELHGMGVDPALWPTWTIAQQVPYVRRFWHARREALAREKGAAMRSVIYRDAPHLYAANFWPEGMQAIDATDYPLLTSATAPTAYRTNRVLDRDGDGAITIDDFAAWLEVRKTDPRLGEPDRYAELRARFDAIRGGGGGGGAVAASGAVALVLAAAAIGAKIVMG